MAEVDDRSRETHSWQCVFELSKGAQCHLRCNSIMFALHLKKNRVNSGPAFIKELSQRSCFDVGSVTRPSPTSHSQ